MGVSTIYLETYRSHDELVQNYWRKIGAIAHDEIETHRERNKMSLNLIGDRFKHLNVLAIGSGYWQEAEFFTELECKSKLRTDLFPIEGIDQLVDATEMPFDNNSFGAIVCREVAQLVPNDRVLLKEIFRVLAKKGYVLITVPNEGKLSQLHLRTYSLNSLNKLLEANHFELVSSFTAMGHIFTLASKI